MKIIDNCIDEKCFQSLQNSMLSLPGDFPWYVNQTIHDSVEIQLTHTIYSQEMHKPISNMFEHMKPVLDILNPRALVRIKANLQLRQKFQVESNYHTDLRKEQCRGITTAILYMNTNNGYTKFRNGGKVESVANRLVCFDAEEFHTGVACTDEPFRVVVNFNLFTFA